MKLKVMIFFFLIGGLSVYSQINNNPFAKLPCEMCYTQTNTMMDSFYNDYVNTLNNIWSDFYWQMVDIWTGGFSASDLFNYPNAYYAVWAAQDQLYRNYGFAAEFFNMCIGACV